MTGRSQHSYDSLREYLAGNEKNDNDIVNVVLSGAVNSGQETDNLISILFSFSYFSHHTTLLHSLTSLHLIYLFLKGVPVAGRLLCDKAVSLFGVYVREWGETDWTGHDEVTLLTGGGPTSGRLPDRPPAASTQAYQHSGSGWRERGETGDWWGHRAQTDKQQPPLSLSLSSQRSVVTGLARYLMRNLRKNNGQAWAPGRGAQHRREF